MSAQVAADLRAAAEVLRRDGWTQGVVHDPNTGRRCAWGGLCEAVNDGFSSRSDGFPFEEALDMAAERLRMVINAAIAVWNDTPGRTADEVIATLEAAADAAEATA